jgi:site-specific recombinase XerD
VIEVLFGIGLRNSELRAARVLDLQLATGTLIVRRAKRSNSSRALPIPKAAVAHLESYLRDGRSALVKEVDTGYLFLSKTGKPLTERTVERIVSKAARRAGIKAFPHAIRRAMATGLVRSGVNARAVQEMLGHESLETTARYLSCDGEEMRRAVDVLEHRFDAYG